MRSVFARLGAWCVERPGPVIALAVLLAILGVVGALSLKPNGEADTLVDESSETFQATEELKEKFGDDPIVVLIKGDLEQLVLTEDLQRILFLESCLAGTAPEGEVAKGIETPEVCNDLADSKPARVVYGPATFLNQFATQASEQFTAAAGRGPGARPGRGAGGLPRRDQGGARQGRGDSSPPTPRRRRFRTSSCSRRSRSASKYGLEGLPSIQDPHLRPRGRLRQPLHGPGPQVEVLGLLPIAESAAISVRLRPDLTEEERSEAIDQIRDGRRQKTSSRSGTPRISSRAHLSSPTA